MKNWYKWKQLWWNLKYTFNDWQNSLSIKTFNDTIIVKTIESNFDTKVEPLNSDEATLREKNAQEYYKRNKTNAYTSYNKIPEHRLIYEENGNLINEEGKKVGYKEAVNTGYEFQKWFNTVPK